jgi:hypothetical protein
LIGLDSVDVVLVNVETKRVENRTASNLASMIDQSFCYPESELTKHYSISAYGAFK